MNNIPCGKCKQYDPMMGPRNKDTKKGWCKKRSKYPAQEGPGQLFPIGVERVAPGELAKPFIVRAAQVVEACAWCQETKQNLVKEKQALYTRSGKTNKKGKKLLE